MSERRLNLAVLISGGGTTLQNLVDAIGAGALDAHIKLVIASRAGIAGIERAKRAELPLEITCDSPRIFELCDRAQVDLICLGGWLCLLDIPRHYENRILNIHPSLLPSFGGKGMFGMKVHQAVLDCGSKVSGCTVHFVDAEYDKGPIILQRTCPVLDDDTPETLAARVFEEEKIAYPEAIRAFAEGRLHIEGRRVRISPSPSGRGSG
jgi:phosphoribosylglycinamide formyltransferase-1